jgi:WD40 repeat protein
MIGLNTEKQSETKALQLESPQGSALEHSWQQLLPSEPSIVYNIFYNLSPWGADTLRLVCKDWYQSFEYIKDAFSKNDSFCQELFRGHFPSVDATRIENFRESYRNFYFNLLEGTYSSHSFEGNNKSFAVAMRNGMVYLASANIPGQIEVWDQKTHLLKHTFQLYPKPISAITIQGEHLFSGHSNGVITIWNLKSSKLICTLKEHEGFITSLVASDGILGSACQDATLRIWNLENFKLTSTIKLDCESPKSLLIDHGKLYLATDKTINVWELRNFKHVATLTEHKSQVTSLAIENGKLYSGSWDKTVKVWNLEDLSCIASCATLGNTYFLEAENGRLFIALETGNIQVLDSNTYAKIALLPQTQGNLVQLVMKDGVLCSIGRSVKTWDFTANPLETLKEIPSRLEHIEYRAVVKREDVSAFDNSVFKWFKRMPKATKDSVFLELFKILEAQFEDRYPGCAEDAFYGRNGQYASRHQKAEAIRNYLAKK